MDRNQMDEFLKALASAYVWVASADKGVDATEWVKYEHVMVQSQFATQFATEDVRRYFKDMVAMFADDYNAGIELTKTRLEQIRPQGHLAEEVIRICRAAVVGDGKIEEPEEIALNEVFKVLGIPADL